VVNLPDIVMMITFMFFWQLKEVKFFG